MARPTKPDLPRAARTTKGKMTAATKRTPSTKDVRTARPRSKPQTPAAAGPRKSIPPRRKPSVASIVEEVTADLSKDPRRER